MVHCKNAPTLWQDLRSQVRKIVLADRKAKRHTPTDQELRKMSIKQLKKFIADEDARQRTRYDNSSVTTLLTRLALRTATQLEEEEWNLNGTATEGQVEELELAWGKYNRLAQHQLTAYQQSREQQRRQAGRKQAQTENRADQQHSNPEISYLLNSIFVFTTKKGSFKIFMLMIFFFLTIL